LGYFSLLSLLFNSHTPFVFSNAVPKRKSQHKLLFLNILKQKMKSIIDSEIISGVLPGAGGHSVEISAVLQKIPIGLTKRPI
jgi:hypothetical protein